MNYDELQLVLRKNELRDGIIWTMPILLQLNQDERKYCIDSGELGLKSERTGQLFAIINVDNIEELKQLNKIAKQWFGTNDEKHPGVKHFMKSGKYILSGKPSLIEGYNPLSVPNYDISPSQTRDLFSLYGWSDIIGYHTRNVPHRGHEFIQRKALEEINADGIFVSPVTGVKKKGDFTALTLIHCYEELIKEGFYNPFGVLIGPFNTYSRYCGPREAVFTALCRKNYGCNHFIVGRDHTGVGNYYSTEASKRIFNQLETGMNILFYEKVSYCSKRDIYTDDFNEQYLKNNKLELSGSLIRRYLLNGEKIPEYLLRTSIFNELRKLKKQRPKQIFHE